MSAVEDARYNAQINKVHHALFYASRAEDVLGDLLQISNKKAETDNDGADTQWRLTSNTPCIAVVDPPRAGLHPNVIRYRMICIYNTM